MDLKRVIRSLITAVVTLAVISLLSWFMMGKQNVTHLSTQPITSHAPQTHVSRAFAN
ncbi:hypothetical protein IV54_GL002136 [Levilactobacillus paucivorans]|uniref:Uncharacterized protein n=1 Tax=Levilactobacillus paucivorans TaxID=616990 RepID=A0A0R2LUR5_9LACO|nr:hypothetical protein [Levilactobacillus paucivorans]KRO03675.1 hypothetical protein IV54_GL002136 [Levilactobacillus paucivorans]